MNLRSFFDLQDSLHFLNESVFFTMTADGFVKIVLMTLDILV